MNVIFGTADYECGAFPLLEYTSLIGEKTLTGMFGNPQLAMFGAVNQMDKVLDEGLRHGMFPPNGVALSGLVFVVVS